MDASPKCSGGGEVVPAMPQEVIVSLPSASAGPEMRWVLRGVCVETGASRIPGRWRLGGPTPSSNCFQPAA